MKYIPYVNIKQGSASICRFSNGNTLPLVQRPFGMAPFCLQSDAGGGRWFFHPDHPCTEGIRLTHQPSPWLGEYATFLMIPQNDVISIRLIYVNDIYGKGLNQHKRCQSEHCDCHKAFLQFFQHRIFYRDRSLCFPFPLVYLGLGLIPNRTIIIACPPPLVNRVFKKIATFFVLDKYEFF